MSAASASTAGGFSELLGALRWRVSALGRAAASFRPKRHDYYLYLGQLLIDSHGKMTMQDIFEKDAERYLGKPRGVLTRHWAERHQDGADLVKTWSGTLPSDDLLIIGAAAQAGGAGAIEEALLDAARLAKRAEETKDQFTSTIFIGLLAMGMAAAVVMGMPLFFIPLLKKSFVFIPAHMWGPKGTALVSFAAFVGTWWPALAGAVVAAITAGVYLLPRWTGKGRAWMDRRFLPYRLYRDSRAAEFLATLAAVLKKRGNVSLNVREGLELIKGRSNKWLSQHCGRMLGVLDDPSAVQGAHVFDTGLFSSDNVFYIADMMEALGSDEGLQVAGLRIEKEIEQSIQRAGKVLRVSMMLAGVAVMFFMAAWMGFTVSELRAAIAIVFQK